jgi:hypothetical protein
MFSVCQLFYVSSATTPVDSAVIQHILQVARRNNRQLDITGCLLYSGRYFAQVLEGRKEQVQPLAQRIASDPRHRNVRILLETHRIDREYGDWSMGYLHDSTLEDSLGRLLLEGGEPGAIADVIDRMKPDTVMGALA